MRLHVYVLLSNFARGISSFYANSLGAQNERTSVVTSIYTAVLTLSPQNAGLKPGSIKAFLLLQVGDWRLNWLGTKEAKHGNGQFPSRLKWRVRIAEEVRYTKSNMRCVNTWLTTFMFIRIHQMMMLMLTWQTSNILYELSMM